MGVADDGVGFGPGHEQGIACGDDVVEVVQWEDLLVVVEFVGSEFFGQHHGHFGDLDGEGVAVDAGELHCPGIREGHVAVEAPEQCGMVARDIVDQLVIRQNGRIPALMIPKAVAKPCAFWQGFSEFGNALLEFGLAVGGAGGGDRAAWRRVSRGRGRGAGAVSERRAGQAEGRREKGRLRQRVVRAQVLDQPGMHGLGVLGQERHDDRDADAAADVAHRRPPYAHGVPQTLAG